jgi:hypothetical protein
LQFGADFVKFFSDNGVNDLINFLKRGWCMRYLKFCIPGFLFLFTASSADASAPTPAPEPGVLLLLGAGLVAIAIWGYRRRKKKFSSKP